MRAVREATSTIPVVFLHVDDPVANGWIQSLARPGGNLTGFVGAPDLPDKRIEYFKALVPSLRRLLILADPGDPVTPRVLPVAHKAATTLGIELVERNVTDQQSIEQVFAQLRPGEADGIFIASRNIQTNFTLLTVRLGQTHRLPVASHRKEFVAQGALFSYGPDQAATGRAARTWSRGSWRGRSRPTCPSSSATSSSWSSIAKRRRISASPSPSALSPRPPRSWSDRARATCAPCNQVTEARRAGRTDDPGRPSPHRDAPSFTLQSRLDLGPFGVKPPLPLAVLP